MDGQRGPQPRGVLTTFLRQRFDKERKHLIFNEESQRQFSNMVASLRGVDAPIAPSRGPALHKCTRGRASDGHCHCSPDGNRSRSRVT